MHRRKFLISGLALSTGLAGCAGGDSNGGGERTPTTGAVTSTPRTSEPAGDSGRTATATEKDTTTTDASSGQVETVSGTPPYTFEGTGNATKRGVTFERGFVRWNATHNGGGRFRIVATNSDGETQTVVDETGEYSGQLPGLVRDGEYTLEILADGQWTIELRQPPREADGEGFPRSYNGTGSDVVYGPMGFEGNYVFIGSHSGAGRFNVMAWFRRPIRVFDADGTADDTKQIAADLPGWVSVQADGEWTLEIRRN